jgi:hypothetical protein
MANITYRSTKGSPLNNNEVDGNFSLLDKRNEGYLTKNITSNYILTSDECDNYFIDFTGSGGPYTISFQTGIKREWVLRNSSTATLYAKVDGGTKSILLYTGYWITVSSNGVEVSSSRGFEVCYVDDIPGTTSDRRVANTNFVQSAMVYKFTAGINHQAVFNDDVFFNNTSDVRFYGNLLGDTNNIIKAPGMEISTGYVSSYNYRNVATTYADETIGKPYFGTISVSLYPTGVYTYVLRNSFEEAGLFDTQKVIQTRIHEACPAIIQPFGNSTTVTNIGCAHTTLGTATARTVVFTGSNIVTRARRIGYVSAASAGSFAGLYFNSAVWGAAGNGFCLSFTFSTSSSTAVPGSRAFYGLSSSVAAPTNVEPSTITNCFGIAKLSTSQNLHIVRGGTLAQPPVDLGIHVPADRLGDTLYRVNIYVYNDGWLGTVYKGSIEAVVGSPQYTNHTFSYIDTGNTELPDPSTPLAPRFWRCNNATATSVALDMGTITIEDLPH